MSGTERVNSTDGGAPAPDPRRSREVVPESPADVEQKARDEERIEGHHRPIEDDAGINPMHQQTTDPRPSAGGERP